MGVALLMHRGMLAWMRAWSNCTQSSEAVAMKEPPDHVPVPGHLQPEVVAILAGMAWNHYQGVA
jgi:hypothetical protein